MQSRTSHWQWIIVGICCCYLGFEIFYNYYAILSVDEFWFAHNIYQFKDKLPYRDFAPYKTTLGYYLLLPFLLAKVGVLTPLYFVKNSIALLNTFIMLFSVFFLNRYFSKKGILAALIVILTSELVLDYSTNLRVDLLGYWFGFFALIALLEKRVVLSGLLMGLGFAVTQKVLWYIFAADVALGFYWLLLARNWRNLKLIIYFNLSISATILAYILLWSYLVDWHTVVQSVFYEAAIMYQLDWYASARLLFWKTLSLHNPMLLFLWPLSLFSLLITYKEDHAYQVRFIIVIFNLTIFGLLIPYQQIFPYYLQVAIPCLFLLFSAFFSWLQGIFIYKPELLVPRFFIYSLLITYVLAVIWFAVVFELPYAYLVICLIPYLLGNYLAYQPLCHPSLRNLFFNLIVAILIMVIGIFPFMLFCIKTVQINGAYQKANLDVMNQLLADESDYIAGIELIYNKTQPIPGMRHLMGPALDYLSHPTPKLRRVMLSSLNEDPNATIQSVITALENSKIKFFVNNYRMNELPPPIKNFLNNQYEHYFGSIYLYAPLISPTQTFTLKFSGNYKIESNSSEAILLNNHTYFPNQIITLTKNSYTSESKQPYRLKLLPKDIVLPNIGTYQTDLWQKMMI